MTDFSVLICDKKTFHAVYEFPVVTGAFDVNLYGGCGQAQFEMGWRYDLYRELAALYLHAPVKVTVLDNVLWQGYITQFRPAIRNDKEYLQIICDGWGQWLKHIGPIQFKWRKGQPDPATLRITTYYSDIVRNIVEKHILPDKKSGITEGTIIDSDELPDQNSDTDEHPANFTMLLQSAHEGIDVLAKLAGNWQWGVDRNRQFYFMPTVQDIAYNIVVGRDVMEFKPTLDSTKIVNYTLVRAGTGTNLADEEYQLFYLGRDPGSIESWGTHFTTRSQPEINDRASAERYCDQLFEQLAEPQDRVTLKLAPNFGLFEPGLGRVHVFAPPHEHYDYSILRTRYRLDDTGLWANPDLGYYPPSIATEIERLKIEISKLHKEGSGEEFYIYDDNWNITELELNITCALTFV